MRIRKRGIALSLMKVTGFHKRVEPKKEFLYRDLYGNILKLWSLISKQLYQIRKQEKLVQVKFSCGGI